MPDVVPDIPVRSVLVAPRGRGVALAALALGGVGIGTGEFVPMGLLPNIAEGVEVSITTGGHAISAYALGVVVGAPIIAVLAARVRQRLLLVALMLAFAIGNVLSAAAPGYESLIVARFLAGLPHGAYFGVASLVAASMVEPERRTWAIGQMMLGLSVANLLVVPLLTVVGQHVSWRLSFAAVAGVALVTAVLVARLTPDPPSPVDTSMLRELGALARPQVLLTAAVGAIGFGGMFAVYSYIAPIMTERAGMREAFVPLVLAIWGLGMVVGNTSATRIVDRWPRGGLVAVMVAFCATLLLFALVSRHQVLACGVAFVLGICVVLAPALQTRLMDHAGDAQTLAASLNHSAFNVANASGAFFAGMAYDATHTWLAPPLVGAGLSFAGLLVLLVALGVERRAA